MASPVTINSLYFSRIFFISDLVTVLSAAPTKAINSDTLMTYSDGGGNSVEFTGTGFNSGSGQITGVRVIMDSTLEFEFGGFVKGQSAIDDMLSVFATSQDMADIAGEFGMDFVIDTTTDNQRGFYLLVGGDDALTLGSANDEVMINGGDDNIDTGDGDDVIYAGNVYSIYLMSGTTMIAGGAGTDTFALTQGLTPVFQLVTKATRVDLAGINASEYGFLYKFSGVENLSGSRFNDTLLGNGMDNDLRGLAGGDVLRGRGGIDTLTGDVGNDTFRFNTAAEAGLGRNRDIITDFRTGADTIDVSAINPMVPGRDFTFIGSSEFGRHRGELRAELVNEPGTKFDRTIVEGDIDGNGRADFQIELVGLIALRESHFDL